MSSVTYKGLVSTLCVSAGETTALATECGPSVSDPSSHQPEEVRVLLAPFLSPSSLDSHGVLSPRVRNKTFVQGFL